MAMRCCISFCGTKEGGTYGHSGNSEKCGKHCGNRVKCERYEVVCCTECWARLDLYPPLSIHRDSILQNGKYNGRCSLI